MQAMTESLEQIYRNDIIGIVTGVLTTMANYEVAASNDTYRPGKGRVTCAVSFAGLWKGMVLIECPLSMAFRITAAFMRVPEPSTFNDDVSDSMGELVNMIGGNLKGVLPQGVILSMPAVVEGSDYSFRTCGASHSIKVSFDSPDGSFWVTFTEVLTGSLPVRIHNGNQAD